MQAHLVAATELRLTPGDAQLLLESEVLGARDGVRVVNAAEALRLVG